MVERDLAKVDVAGSTPVSRSRLFSAPARDSPPGRKWTFSSRNASLVDGGRGTQVVRERSAKPLCVGSIPTRASNLSLQLPVCLAVRFELSFRVDWA